MTKQNNKLIRVKIIVFRDTSPLVPTFQSNLLLPSLREKMQVWGSSEMMVIIYQTTMGHTFTVTAVRNSNTMKMFQSRPQGIWSPML
jgi:hypothetical protein